MPAWLSSNCLWVGFVATAVCIGSVLCVSGCDTTAEVDTEAVAEAAALEQDAAPLGSVTYRLTDGHDDWPAEKREQIVAVMDYAVGFYNRHAALTKEIRVSYNPQTPTADGNYNGHIRFGGSINERVALHEVCHTLGVGTTRQWRDGLEDGRWTGPAANALLKSWDGDDAVLNGDRQHFWPYGLNYDREDGEQARERHVLIVAALVRDMGLPEARKAGDAAD